MDRKFFFVDTETGGLEREHSLLTMYGAIYDQNLKLIDEIDLKVMPDSGIFNVTAKAMEVNKIDLEEHKKVATPYTVAGPQLLDFLRSHAGQGRLYFAGQNVEFDKKFIQQYLIAEASWDKVIAKVRRDTIEIAETLRELDLMPAGEIMGSSLSKFAEYFGIRVSENLHDAKNDVKLTVKVYQCMMDKLKTSRKIITEI